MGIARYGRSGEGQGEGRSGVVDGGVCGGDTPAE